MPDFKKLRESGFCLIRGFMLGETTEEIGKSLGKVYDPESLPIVQPLKPGEKSSSKPNLYTGIFGRDAFPMHTDLPHWNYPPRYILLRAIIPCEKVETRLMLFDDALRYCSESCISRASYFPRKPLGPNKALLRFYDREKYRWDSVFLSPANKEAEEVNLCINYTQNSKKVKHQILKESGDILLVDNWRCLHGRSAVSLDSSKREIERIYLEEI